MLPLESLPAQGEAGKKLGMMHNYPRNAAYLAWYPTCLEAANMSGERLLQNAATHIEGTQIFPSVVIVVYTDHFNMPQRLL